jgi:hypothetical protein
MPPPTPKAHIIEKTDRARELKLRRNKLNIPAKTICKYMNCKPSTLQHIEYSTGHHFSDTLLDRYETAIRDYCRDLTKLIASWGYQCESLTPPTSTAIPSPNGTKIGDKNGTVC